jgi:CotH kinase protein/Chitobiase/beta-hexosaminidase C-terminal domain/Lamin Tail Domain
MLNKKSKFVAKLRLKMLLNHFQPKLFSVPNYLFNHTMQSISFKKAKIPTLFLLLFLLAKSISAQITVNEYSAANWKQYKDNYNNTEDWIELHNSAATATDISAWGLTDDDTDLQKWKFPAGTSIPAGGFLTVWCSKRNTSAGGVLHTNFSLTQTKGNDIIVLSKANGFIVNTVTVEKTQFHQSRCRTTDGASAWRVCTTPTLGVSNNGSTQFSGFATRPEMSLEAGFYTTNQTVNITTTEAGANLHYTIDGTQPNLNSPIYAEPLTLDKTTVVKAIAYSADASKLPSFIQFNTYFINEDFSLVVVSVGADSVLELANGDKELRPVGTIEYFGQDKLRKTRSFGELNSHGQDSWVNDQRSLDWVSRDEMGYSNALKEKLFSYSDRTEYQRVILRASGDDGYPGNMLPEHEGCAHIRDEYCQTLAKLGGMKLDVRAAERMIVFLNGEYWGVYGLREYPDDADYTEEYYNQGKYDIQILETWGDTWAEYGGEQAFTDWRELQNFILNNDMSVQANYDRVKDELNVVSLCDYFITGLNFVASDWINYNTAWWRGTDPNGNHKKWGYMLWDYDAVFNYYINYSGVPNTDPTALPCDIDEISDYIQNDFFGFFGGTNDTCLIFEEPGFPADTFCIKGPGQHDLIFKKLQTENPEFRQLYYARQADMQNTVFSCDNMLHVLDSMVAVIDPEMTRHAARWGGTYDGWKQNVAKMRDFIEQRCTLLDDGMVECFDITGPYNVTLQVEPLGAGTIDFNTLKIESFPWNGNYFGGMENLIEAKPTGALSFLRWESRATSPITPDLNTSKAAITISQTDTLVAVFGIASSTWTPGNGYVLSVNPTVVSQNVWVNYQLPEAAPVTISLLDITGRKVFEDLNQNTSAGSFSLQIDFENKNLASGVYLLDFVAGNVRKQVKLVYLGEK